MITVCQGLSPFVGNLTAALLGVGFSIRCTLPVTERLVVVSLVIDEFSFILRVTNSTGQGKQSMLSRLTSLISGMGDLLIVQLLGGHRNL